MFYSITASSLNSISLSSCNFSSDVSLSLAAIPTQCGESINSVNNVVPVNTPGNKVISRSNKAFKTPHLTNKQKRKKEAAQKAEIKKIEKNDKKVIKEFEKSGKKIEKGKGPIDNNVNFQPPTINETVDALINLGKGIAHISNSIGEAINKIINIFPGASASIAPQVNNTVLSILDLKKVHQILSDIKADLKVKELAQESCIEKIVEIIEEIDQIIPDQNEESKICEAISKTIAIFSSYRLTQLIDIDGENCLKHCVDTKSIANMNIDLLEYTKRIMENVPKDIWDMVKEKNKKIIEICDQQENTIGWFINETKHYYYLEKAICEPLFDYIKNKMPSTTEGGPKSIFDGVPKYEYILKKLLARMRREDVSSKNKLSREATENNLKKQTSSNTLTKKI